MAYQLPHLYDTDGSDLTNASHTTTLDGANNMAYDGKYLWVACGTNGIGIFEWYGENTDNEPTFDELDDLILPWYGATEYDETLALVVGTPKNLKYPRVSAVTVTTTSGTALNLGTDYTIDLVAGTLTAVGTAKSVKVTYNYNTDIHRKLRLVTYITISTTQIKRTTGELGFMLEDSTTYSQAITGETIYYKAIDRVGPALNAFYIQKLGDKMYVTNTSTFKEVFVFDIPTQMYSRVIDVSETFTDATNEFFVKNTVYGMNSNLEVANGKLWFVGSAFGETWPQRIYNFDPATDTKSYGEIDAKPSRARIWVSNGYNGYVYCTNPNNVSVSKFLDTTGAYVSTIRVNSDPTRIFADASKKIWVNSYAGMLSLLDWDDDQSHLDWATTSDGGDRALALQVDPNDSSFIWFLDNGGVLVRHNLNDHTQIESVLPTVTDPNKKDWQFYHAKLKSPTMMWISPAGTVGGNVLKPYMFLLQDKRLVAWRLENVFRRPVYAEVSGIAAVTNQLEYFGG